MSSSNSANTAPSVDEYISEYDSEGPDDCYSEGEPEGIDEYRSEDESEAFDDEPYKTRKWPTTLADIPGKSKLLTIPVDQGWCGSAWGHCQAARELFQNWRDSIIKVNRLRQRDFKVERVVESGKGKGTTILYRVPNPNRGPGEYLGYIKYTGEDGQGTVEITNRNATLQPRHLRIGNTSKNGDSTQAGVHGEGLKVALLIMVGRQNHKIRCRTGGFDWHFKYTHGDDLEAFLRRLTDTTMTRAIAEAEKSDGGGPRCAARPGEDVQFFIGDGTRAGGRNRQKAPVRQSDFEEWTKVALFLQPSQGNERTVTAYGDLLRETNLCGKIFLKGLLLGDTMHIGSITHKPLKYGYNLANGTTFNRDRQGVGLRDEKKGIMDIWDEVLLQEPHRAGDFLAMLNCEETDYADVARAKEGGASSGTVTRLRQHLRIGDRDSKYWYHTAVQKLQCPDLDITIAGLEREGRKVTDHLWRVLNKFEPLRTAEKESRLRLGQAPYVDDASFDRGFAKDVRHHLLECMQACPAMRGITVQFVHGGNLRCDLILSPEEQRVRVHDKWLTEPDAKEGLSLPQGYGHSVSLPVLVVMELFTQILGQIPDERFDDDGISTTADQKRKCQKYKIYSQLMEHPRNVPPPVPRVSTVRLQWDPALMAQGMQIPINLGGGRTLLVRGIQPGSPTLGESQASLVSTTRAAGAQVRPAAMPPCNAGQSSAHGPAHRRNPTAGPAAGGQKKDSDVVSDSGEELRTLQIGEQLQEVNIAQLEWFSARGEDPRIVIGLPRSQEGANDDGIGGGKEVNGDSRKRRRPN